MIEDSVTTIDYGVIGFPLMVVVGRDGKIAYADYAEKAPPRDDPAAQAGQDRRETELLQHYFATVGEPWPISDKLDPSDATPC